MELTGDPLLIGLQITVTGVTVVFMALTVVALALGALRGIDRPFARLRRAAAPANAGAAPSADVPAAQLTPELVAVLVAAATEALDQPVRVTRVRYHGELPASAWSRQGRIAVMASRQRRG